jgi:acetyl esterase/lipase
MSQIFLLAGAFMTFDPMRCRPWVLLSLVVTLAGCDQMAVKPTSAPQPSAAASSRALRLTSEPVAIHTRDVEYLQVDGQAFKATIYQPEGPGPFPAILDVHGGAWVREDVRRDEHTVLDGALAAMGMVVVAIDFRQSPQNRYPDSVVDVNFALRWLRANASKFNASPQVVGALGSSSGGHLILLNSMRADDPRYAALALTGVSADSAKPNYIILVYPISDPLARRAYAEKVGNNAPVKSTDIYFSPPGSVEDGNPQLILSRHESVNLPPVLLLQGNADADGVVKDTNVSPEIQQRFAASYRAANGKLQLELLPGAPHNFVNMSGANLDRALGLMKTFIEQQLAGQ